MRIKRKLRVATKIGAHFFGFSQVTGQLKSCKMTFYHHGSTISPNRGPRAGALSPPPKIHPSIISMKFPIDRIPHALYLIFGTLAGLWPWAIGPSLKIEILGFFIITMKFLIHRV
jgi:hypothetical protein